MIPWQYLRSPFLLTPATFSWQNTHTPVLSSSHCITTALSSLWWGFLSRNSSAVELVAPGCLRTSTPGTTWAGEAALKMGALITESYTHQILISVQRFGTRCSSLLGLLFSPRLCLPMCLTLRCPSFVINLFSLERNSVIRLCCPYYGLGGVLVYRFICIFLFFCGGILDWIFY